ncbi:hypothetical protein [Micromonospora costi]|nr:hypothetical protein [Micromonospora costi]
MGLPAHWVTGPTPDLPRTGALRVLGNGVVPAQAATALRLLLCRHAVSVPNANRRVIEGQTHVAAPGVLAPALEWFFSR